MEDYKKKYEEALKRAKDVYTYYSDDTEQLRKIESIFPELAESEDEKIRKVLIKFHKSTIDIDGIKGEDILAWLEKQGEQKSVIIPKFRVGDTVKSKTMDNFIFTIKDITGKQYVDTNGGKYNIEGQDYLELVEQKPNPCLDCTNRKGCINCENGELRETEQKPA